MSIIKYISSKSIGLYFNTLAYINPEKLKKEGFQLFCNPFSRKLKPHHQDFLKSGFDEILEIGGNRIQTYKWGNGSSKIVLVHGWASHTFRWKAYVNMLVKNDCTVLAFDAPAHGNSTGKLLNLVIYETVLTHFLEKHKDVNAIMGHSIGGFATTYYLSRNLETPIKKAVILAAPGKVEEFFGFYVKFLGLSKKAIDLITQQFEIELKQKPSYFKATEFANNIKVNALIIHDKQDNSTNFTDSEKLHKAWKASTLKITDGLGHELKSKELLSEIIEFIK